MWRFNLRVIIFVLIPLSSLLFFYSIRNLSILEVESDGNILQISETVDLMITKASSTKKKYDYGSIIESMKINKNNSSVELKKRIPQRLTSDDKTQYQAKKYMLKDVGEPYLDHFGLDQHDFDLIRDAGINVIEGNFDICASDEDVKYFLDKSYANNLTVILNAGSGEAEWGYECDAEFPNSQKPIWDSGAVNKWVDKWRNHPALFAWDISNEAGGNFPNGEDKAYMLTLKQLQTAYNDVKSFDPSHPIMVRMNGWYFYDYDSDFFRTGNPYGENVADIVMINAYSNVDEYFPDFVQTVTSRAIIETQQYNAKTSYIISLGIWSEPPLWEIPTRQHLQDEFRYLSNRTDIDIIAFFKYGAKESEWYLPRQTIEGENLYGFLQKLTNTND